MIRGRVKERGKERKTCSKDGSLVADGRARRGAAAPAKKSGLAPEMTLQSITLFTLSLTEFSLKINE